MSANPDNRRLKQICFKHANAEVERRFPEEIARAEVLIDEADRLRDEIKAVNAAIFAVMRRPMGERADVGLLSRRHDALFERSNVVSAERIEIQFVVTKYFDKIFRQCYERGLRVVR